MELKQCKQCAEHRPLTEFGRSNDLPCFTCALSNMLELQNRLYPDAPIAHIMTIQEHYRVINCLRDLRDKNYTDIDLEARIQAERVIFLQSVKESTSMTKLDKRQAKDLDRQAEALYRKNRAYWLKKTNRN